MGLLRPVHYYFTACRGLAVRHCERHSKKPNPSLLRCSQALEAIKDIWEGLWRPWKGLSKGLVQACDGFQGLCCFYYGQQKRRNVACPPLPTESQSKSQKEGQEDQGIIACGLPQLNFSFPGRPLGLPSGSSMAFYGQGGMLHILFLSH